MKKILSGILTVIFYFFANSTIAQEIDSTDSIDSVKVKGSHPKKSPKEKGFVIYSDKGKSYLKIYGEIRLNGAFDFNGLQASQTFDVYDIPVGPANSPDGRFYFSVFQTRFGFEGSTNSKLGNIYIRFEGDFLGSNNSFRIRHAYGKLNNFLLGKTRTLFADDDAIPAKVDREGPNFALAERTIQVRFEPPKDKGIRWGVAVETPEADITNPDSAISTYYQSIPELVSKINIENKKWGHIQLAGIFRNINVRNLDESLEFVQGYGALYSGLLKFAEKSNFKFQLFAGKAIAHYIKALKGEGLDVIFDDIDNVYVPMPVYGGFVSVFHQWTKILSSDFTVGYAKINNLNSQPGTAFNKGYYGAANLFVTPIDEKSELGVEYSWGKRLNINGEYGTANRISFITFFYF